LFLVSSYFFVLGIREGELTVLYPMVSIGYFFTLIWARLFFGEPFTRFKFIGLALILTGIFFLGLGKSHAGFRNRATPVRGVWPGGQLLSRIQ
jgi:multidrug transporter EmrE-like cation transporter